MKITTFRIRHLLAAMLCAFGLPASAQLSKTVEQYVDNSYLTVTAEFTMTEVAQALATDTATLCQALDAWYGDETGTAEKMFFLADPDDASVLSDNYTQGSPGGFWVGADGRPMGWGDGCRWYNTIGWYTGTGENGEAVDAFNIYLGQFPESAPDGATYTPKFVMKYGGKQVTFDITYIIKPAPTMPKPTTVKLSELNVVGSGIVNAHRTDIQGYDATALSFNAQDIIEKLGLDQSLVQAYLPQMLYAEWRDKDGLCKDSLTNASTATAPGWWLQQMLYPQGHELQGEPSPNLGAADYGADCHIFLEAFAYDEATNAITCNLGQYPGKPAAGDSVSANIYVIYADKAYKINYQVVFDEAPNKGLDDMTSVGSVSHELTFYDDFADYQIIEVNVDVDAITAALGCGTDAIQLTTLKDDETLWVGSGTANNGGFWVNDGGYATNYATGAACFEPATQGDYSLFNLMLHPNVKTSVGSTYPVHIYFVNGEKYYTIDVTCTILHKEIGDQSGWQVIDQRPASVQVIASSTDYLADGNQSKFTLTSDQIADVLGTTTFKMYCATHDSIAKTGELYAPYSKYLCSPAPGIWFNAEGRGSGYNGSQTVGICWDETTGEFTVYQMPGVNSVGSVFTAPIYFVDEETGKMLEVDFTVTFVSEIKTSEIVGTEDITLATAEEFKTAIDLTKPAEALGVTVEELLASYAMKGLKSNGLYSDGQDPLTTGLALGSDGYYDEYGTNYLMIIEGESGYELVLYWSDEVAEDFRTSGAFCFEIDEKMYVYNVAFVAEGIYAGIKNVKTADNAKELKIYDLSGRRVQNPTKGLYIINGKKYVVK